MDRAKIEGLELEYELSGTGEAVVMIHGGLGADWFKPLAAERTLSDRYRILRYHRVGYAGSSHLSGTISIALQAGHCRLLMRHLGIDRGHIVGQSSGANIALQLALDFPRAVHSLALLEPALQQVPSATGPSRAFVGSAMERHRAGDKAGAVDLFLQGVCGPDYRGVLETALPGAFDRAVADADTFFNQELPAVQKWSLKADDAKSIRQPALAVIGEKSKELSPIWSERHELLLSWLPKLEPFVLAGATHLLQLQNAGGMARNLGDFFARHPVSIEAGAGPVLR